MARRRRNSKSGIVAQLKKRGAEYAEIEPAQDDQAIMVQFGISKPTLRRWRIERNFPVPDFFIGLRGFTWAHRVTAWTEQQPKQNPLGGQSLRSRASGSEAA
ncbi:MAG: hypothetical protein ABS54_07720 [Hyphomicrobium sp. SCN 65-11]|nr:MAG: hypothetical protein ABS54_07720 [Hyphomicrobium sp. SCN 65-11]